MIERIASTELLKLSRQFKVVAIIGPRQSGKTTLAKHVFANKPYISLENPDHRRFAMEDPRGFLAQFPQGAVLDEAQRTPDLFSYLQQILDEDTNAGKFILTGSNNFLLQENISQSLAGRIAYLILLPFSASELKENLTGELTDLLFNGTYPPIYDQPVEPVTWYANYIRTYIERDVRQIKNITDLIAFERFLRLCAGRIGQLLNMSSLAIETGVDSKTIASWIGVLENSFIIHLLQPHHKNFNKRVVKMPKLYFYDTGLVCALLGIKHTSQLNYHPLAGNIFENFVVSELIKYRTNRAQTLNFYFWRDSVGHEIDLIVENALNLFPIEIKSGKTITSDFFKNILYWQTLANQSGGAIIYSGETTQVRSNGIEILPWQQLEELKGL